MKMLVMLLAVLIGAVCLSVNAATDLGDVSKSLLSDIKKSQQALTATEKRIASERKRLALDLQKEEQAVIKLREVTAVARRLADENTLSLTQLQKRLETWQQQYQYQTDLLNRFLRQNVVPASNSAFAEQLQAVTDFTASLQANLYPRWTLDTVVLPSGNMVEMETLTLGPVRFYSNNNDGDWQAGILATDNGINKIALVLPAGDAAALEQLKLTGQGLITFDPSLNRAMARAQNSESTFQHLEKGGFWAVPILLFALFALTIGLIKGLQMWRLAGVATLGAAQLQHCFDGGAVNSASIIASSMQKNLLKISVENKKGQIRDDQLFTQLLADKHRLEYGIGAIAITASVSPLLGLLGTVSGMIETFKMMTLFGSGDPEVVSGGIAQALITTELGLVVAIPALILNALLSRKAKSYYSQLEAFAIQMSQFESAHSAPSPDSKISTKQTDVITGKTV